MVWKSNGFDQYNRERIEELNTELRRLAERRDHSGQQQSGSGERQGGQSTAYGMPARF